MITPDNSTHQTIKNSDIRHEINFQDYTQAGYNLMTKKVEMENEQIAKTPKESSNIDEKCNNKLSGQGQPKTM